MIGLDRDTMMELIKRVTGESDVSNENLRIIMDYQVGHKRTDEGKPLTARMEGNMEGMYAPRFEDPQHVIEMAKRVSGEENSQDENIKLMMEYGVRRKTVDEGTPITARMEGDMEGMYSYRFRTPEQVIEMEKRVTGESEPDDENVRIVMDYAVHMKSADEGTPVTAKMEGRLDGMYSYRFESPEHVEELVKRVTGEKDISDENYRLIREFITRENAHWTDK